jgi:hypothetical protein
MAGNNSERVRVILDICIVIIEGIILPVSVYYDHI